MRFRDIRKNNKYASSVLTHLVYYEIKNYGEIF